MKHFKFTFLALLFTILFIGCGSDDSMEEEDETPTGTYFTCQINGEDFDASVAGIGANFETSAGIVYLVIQGTENFLGDDPEAFILAVGDYTGPGTYRVGSDSDIEYSNIIYDKINESFAGCQALDAAEEAGKIIITSDNGVNLEGEFFMTCLSDADGSTIEISNGSFRAPII